MRALIVCVSVSHGNTRRVADAMAGPLGAAVVGPDGVDPAGLGGYDLVGFGSGIFFERFHPDLRGLVGRLAPVSGPAAFVFATSGAAELPLLPYTRPLRRALLAKGFAPAGSFTCRGYDTWLPLLLVGGVNKGHPDAADLERAAAFAAGLAGRFGGRGRGPARRAG